MRVVEVLGVVALLTLAEVSRPAAQEGPPTFQSQTSDTLWVMDGMLVPACDAAGRSYRRLEGGEIEYKLKGDRDTRDQGIHIYREAYEATGCSAPPRRLNVQVFYGGQATTPVIINLPPGRTAITAGVLGDIMNQTVPFVVATKHRQCATAGPPAGVPIFLVRDTSIVAGTPFVVGAPWTERWSYEACGEAGAVDIEFAYDGTGVAMKTDLPVPDRARRRNR